MSKNNLRGITLKIRLIWEINSLTPVIIFYPQRVHIPRGLLEMDSGISRLRKVGSVVHVLPNWYARFSFFRS